MIRGRFAPTPSGKLHIGNVGTALLSWLQVRSQGGIFVLRMEDIDGARCRKEYADQIIEDLHWLGIDWDEGPDVGGIYGSYLQSERILLYKEAMNLLQSKGLLYPCFCSRKELKMVASAPHGRDSEGPVYPGTCRHLSPEVRFEKAKGKVPSLRYRISDELPLEFIDQKMGQQVFEAGFGGDFVVKRGDGIISYQLAVVVDDAAMNITDVLRGMDLLDSTPRQIWLYKALGYAIPNFTHVPLLHGPGGIRLSKRQGPDITISILRKNGVKPEKIVGALAFLYQIIDRPEPVKTSDLLQCFDLSVIPKEPIEIDMEMFIPND